MLWGSGHKIVGGLVWKQTMRSLQGEGCHVELNFGGSRGKYIFAAWGQLAEKESGRIGSSPKMNLRKYALNRHMSILPTLELYLV